jgi:hypothetical protein
MNFGLHLLGVGEDCLEVLPVSLQVSLIDQSILLCGESEGRVSVLKYLIFFAYGLLLTL